MSKSGRDIQILRNHNVTEILFECNINAPLVTGSFKITLDILSRCYNCSLPGDVESKDDVRTRKYLIDLMMQLKLDLLCNKS